MSFVENDFRSNSGTVETAQNGWRSLWTILSGTWSHRTPRRCTEILSAISRMLTLSWIAICVYWYNNSDMLQCGYVGMLHLFRNMFYTGFTVPSHVLNRLHYEDIQMYELHRNLTRCPGGRHNMPLRLQLDLWLFDLESGVRVTCDVGYHCANFSLPRPLCPRLRPDVRDKQTSDAHHLTPLP